MFNIFLQSILYTYLLHQTLIRYTPLIPYLGFAVSHVGKFRNISGIQFPRGEDSSSATEKTTAALPASRSKSSVRRKRTASRVTAWYSAKADEEKPPRWSTYRKDCIATWDKREREREFPRVSRSTAATPKDALQGRIMSKRPAMALS